MTENIYIKFSDQPQTPEAKKKERWKIKLIETLLFFIPKGIPEYEDLIGDVAEWQLEIRPDNGLPEREIGKDINGNIIFIMPWRNNCGFWTDNQVNLDYFMVHFKATIIDKAEFEKNWTIFANNNPEKIN